MHQKNFLTASNIGKADLDLAIKAAGTQDGLVENINAVGAAENHDFVAGVVKEMKVENDISDRQ